ncbi:MAG TPA: hypothetical protein VJK08_03185 [Patescibacteria group bacterium]|nr:hypothetical protein [Patescibacteria group bacterium]
MAEELDEKPGNKTVLIVSVILILLILAAGIYYFVIRSEKAETPSNTSSTTENTATTSEQSSVAKEVWQDGQVAVAGNFADADVVDLGAGQFRMYYSVEPEVPNNKLEVYSAVSTDGKSWTKEAGTRKTFATFPDVIKLPNGTWRMYFQNAGVIKSATSADGLSWTDEPGTRVDKTESGFNLENVGAQSTTILADGTYLMAYRGMINKPYETTEKLPNQNTQLFFYATSTDGLSFTKKGISVDSRNSTLLGLTDGAEWVNWQVGGSQAELRLYFWSYKGVYSAAYTSGAFSEPVFQFTKNTDALARFPENPPGDPTLAKINDTWFMFYGQHTKGIYYATLQ